MKNVPDPNDSRMGVGEVLTRKTMVEVRHTVKALLRSLRNSGVKNYGVIGITPDGKQKWNSRQGSTGFRVWSMTQSRFDKGLPTRFVDIQLA